MKKITNTQTKANHKGHEANTHHSLDAHSKAVSETPVESSDTLLATGITPTDINALLYMIEEEKMARDIYDTLFEQTGVVSFDKISDSEQKHYDTLVSTAESFGIDISSLSTEAGIFSNDTIQTLYDDLLTQASASTSSAIAVGIAIEQVDIVDLQAAIQTTEITLLGQVYSNLLHASEHHLAAFENIA